MHKSEVPSVPKDYDAGPVSSLDYCVAIKKRILELLGEKIPPCDIADFMRELDETSDLIHIPFIGANQRNSLIMRLTEGLDADAYIVLAEQIMFLIEYQKYAYSLTNQGLRDQYLSALGLEMPDPVLRKPARRRQRPIIYQATITD